MLTDYWYIACRSRQLARRPLVIELLSRNLVLFRTRAGLPAALENRCAHRGMPLSAGRVHGETLQCAYHGWCYDKAGIAVKIPALPPTESLEPRASVPAYLCQEQDGYIWVCLGPDPVHNRPPEFPHSGEHGWTTFRMYNRFEAPVEACLENFLDCPHAAFVHRNWFRSPGSREVRCSIQSLDDGAVAEYFDEPREKSMVWTLLSPSKGGMRHTDRYIAPSTTRVDYEFSANKHYTITSSCTPVNDEQTDVYTVISFRYKVWGPLVRLFFEPLSQHIIAQDIETLKLQQNNLVLHRNRTYRITKQDVLLPHIRRWRKFLSEGRKPSGQSEPYDVQIVI